MKCNCNKILMPININGFELDNSKTYLCQKCKTLYESDVPIGKLKLLRRKDKEILYFAGFNNLISLL